MTELKHILNIFCLASPMLSVTVALTFLYINMSKNTRGWLAILLWSIAPFYLYHVIKYNQGLASNNNQCEKLK